MKLQKERKESGNILSVVGLTILNNQITLIGLALFVFLVIVFIFIMKIQIVFP